jgi:hypothetical protein
MPEGSERVGAMAPDACERTREAVEAALHHQQEAAAIAAQGLADALRRAAQSLAEDDQALVAGYVDRAAAGIDEFSATLRRPWSEILASAESLAERQPALFIAGAVAAGFAIGCVLMRPSPAMGATPPVDLAAGAAARREPGR